MSDSIRNSVQNQSPEQTPLASAPLGKQSQYISTYTPSLLFPIPRKIKRDEISVPHELPFSGFDIWTGFELSWLNPNGKPVVAIAEFRIPCNSKNIIESKSFKLYLNSFNNSKFDSFDKVKDLLEKDLTKNAEAPVSVRLFHLEKAPAQITQFSGECLDDLDIYCEQYQPEPNFLAVDSEQVEETVYTNLLKSNCLVTGQPDWGSILIAYQGFKINHEGLLKYIVSLRNHNEFHEQCVERIFMDIQKKCRPNWLTVYARYTRRGGLDINPYRTNKKDEVLNHLNNIRLIRQ